MKINDFLKLVSIPLLLLAAYFLMYFIWQIFNLPESDDLIVIVKSWFQDYGLWIVFVSALIEGVLLFGNYFPGGIVIFLGVISADGDVERTVWVVFLVCLALFFAYLINYMLGKYGWYKLLIKFGMKESIEKQKEKLGKHQFSAIMGSYWFPNLASITSTAAGILKLPIKKFLFHSAIGVLIWNTFWGILVASLGEKALDMISLKLALLILGIWIAVILIKNRLERNANIDNMSKIPVVNEKDEILEYRERRDTEDSIIRISALIIFNKNKDMLLAQRSFTKVRSPGKWGPAVAGNVEEGEMYEMNIIKEAEEELGLTLTPSDIILGPKNLIRNTQPYFVQTYFIQIDESEEYFKPRVGEVEKVEWIPLERLSQWVKDNLDDFTPAIEYYRILFERLH